MRTQTKNSSTVLQATRKTTPSPTPAQTQPAPSVISLSTERALGPQQVLHLQRTLGNSAVCQLLQTDRSAPVSSPHLPQTTIQRKKITFPDESEISPKQRKKFRIAVEALVKDGNRAALERIKDELEEASEEKELGEKKAASIALALRRVREGLQCLEVQGEKLEGESEGELEGEGESEGEETEYVSSNRKEGVLFRDLIDMVQGKISDGTAPSNLAAKLGAFAAGGEMDGASKIGVGTGIPFGVDVISGAALKPIQRTLQVQELAAGLVGLFDDDIQQRGEAYNKVLKAAKALGIETINDVGDALTLASRVLEFAGVAGTAADVIGIGSWGPTIPVEMANAVKAGCETGSAAKATILLHRIASQIQATIDDRGNASDEEQEEGEGPVPASEALNRLLEISHYLQGRKAAKGVKSTLRTVAAVGGATGATLSLTGSALSLAYGAGAPVLAAGIAVSGASALLGAGVKTVDSVRGIRKKWRRLNKIKDAVNQEEGEGTWSGWRTAGNMLVPGSTKKQRKALAEKNPAVMEPYSEESLLSRKESASLTLIEYLNHPDADVKRYAIKILKVLKVLSRKSNEDELKVRGGFLRKARAVDPTQQKALLEGRAIKKV